MTHTVRVIEERTYEYEIDAELESEASLAALQKHTALDEADRNDFEVGFPRARAYVPPTQAQQHAED